MQEMDMFEHIREGDKRVVSRLSDEENWTRIRDTLLQNTGVASIPVIRITDADYNKSRMLYLEHEFDGRDLQEEYMEHTLAYLYRLWGRNVFLKTKRKRAEMTFTYGENGFEKLRKK